MNSGARHVWIDPTSDLRPPILIPATITFTPGGLYQLWLVALNSRGKSGPGPVQNWTAP